MTSAQRNECEKSDDQSVAIVESVYLGDVGCLLGISNCTLHQFDAQRIKLLAGHLMDVSHVFVAPEL